VTFWAPRYRKPICGCPSADSKGCRYFRAVELADEAYQRAHEAYVASRVAYDQHLQRLIDDVKEAA
jgi:hypothetical protein